MTHYFPYFVSLVRQRVAYAACGEMAHLDDHSAEPTCPTCQAWLMADVENAKAIEDAFENPVYLGPPVTSTFGDRDVTGGRARK